MDSQNSITVEQAKEILAAMAHAVPQDLSSVAALHWTHSKGLLIKKIKQILSDDGARDTGTVLQEWALLYEKFFQFKKDFSGLKIPEPQPGINRLLIISKNISLGQTLRVCSNSFPTAYETLGEFGDDLDKMMKNDREPTEDYAIWVRDVAEAEVEPPANIHDRPMHPSVPEMTLLERLLFEIRYRSETGEHLDTERVTCCFGSTHVESGERPVVCSRGNHLRILWRGDHYTKVLMSCSPYWSRSIVV